MLTKCSQCIRKEAVNCLYCKTDTSDNRIRVGLRTVCTVSAELYEVTDKLLECTQALACTCEYLNLEEIIKRMSTCSIRNDCLKALSAITCAKQSVNEILK